MFFGKQNHFKLFYANGCGTTGDNKPISFREEKVVRLTDDGR